ncbi:hypothetical protein BBOMB_0127 [Bifidobacterium bombi DSM 19703]|uniref:Uncharacterized protein n=1 Tax=Bifidobacterium bombi DSM 19703 TaxID=1341695 RepID=A0A080N3V0_9BIFI|nr:hypothetical protein BBOMB_0127 [Bifidobacterium bombi DSM 19703]
MSSVSERYPQLKYMDGEVGDEPGADADEQGRAAKALDEAEERRRIEAFRLVLKDMRKNLDRERD